MLRKSQNLMKLCRPEVWLNFFKLLCHQILHKFIDEGHFIFDGNSRNVKYCKNIKTAALTLRWLLICFDRHKFSVNKVDTKQLVNTSLMIFATNHRWHFSSRAQIGWESRARSFPDGNFFIASDARRKTFFNRREEAVWEENPTIWQTLIPASWCAACGSCVPLHSSDRLFDGESRESFKQTKFPTLYDARGFPFSSISSGFVVAFPRFVTTTGDDDARTSEHSFWALQWRKIKREKIKCSVTSQFIGITQVR